MIQGQSPDAPIYPIGAVARLLGVSVHTLRMYEREGLILAYHAESGHRLYSQRDVERLQCIRATINVEKISIEGIKRVLTMIPCWVIMNCPETELEACPAYTGHSGPCWSLREKIPFCQSRSCRQCHVYTDLSECGKIKEKMKSLLETRQQHEPNA